jgi:hypothetical protein
MTEGLRADCREDDATIRWQDILDFERSPEHSPSKVVAMRMRFGLSPARYYHLLNRLIDRPEALRYDPMLVRRLRRLREVRRRRRFARRLGFER